MRYDYYLITSQLLVQTDTFIIPIICPSGGSLAAKKTQQLLPGESKVSGKKVEPFRRSTFELSLELV